MWGVLLVIFICSFLAFSISAICGGGAGLILIPILGGILPVTQIPVALSIGTFTSSASRIVVFRKRICWQIVKYFVPAALPAVWLGAWVLKFVNPAYLGIMMGIFLMGNLPFVFKNPKEISTVKKPSLIGLTCIGFLAGFLSGLTGAVGLLFNRLYLRYGLTKEEIVATRAANEVILHLIKIILYVYLQLVTREAITIGIVVATAAFLSTWLMKWILPQLSDVLFKKIGYIAMVVSGFMMIVQSATNLSFSDPEKLAKNTKLKWQNGDYTFEFSPDDGFEFEQVIAMEELTNTQQELVMRRKRNADKIVIEIVYKIGSKSYEAYYINNYKLVDKIEFE